MSIPKWIDVKETDVMSKFNEKVYQLFQDDIEGHIVIGFNDQIHCAVNFTTRQLEMDSNVDLNTAASAVEKLSKGAIPGDAFNVMVNTIRRLSSTPPRLFLSKEENMFIITDTHTVLVNKEEMSALEYIKINNSFH